MTLLVQNDAQRLDKPDENLDEKSLDNGNLCGMLLTDLSKAFDSLKHDLLITKLAAYGFDHPLLCFIHSYLSGRVQRTL